MLLAQAFCAYLPPLVRSSSISLDMKMSNLSVFYVEKCQVKLRDFVLFSCHLKYIRTATG
jgi:hypothetical protein